MIKLRIKPGEVFSAKIQASRLNGCWQPPRLMLGVVTAIEETTYVTDPEKQLPEALPLIKVADLICNLPSADDINVLHPTKGISHIALPGYISKKNPSKTGPMFTRAVEFSDGARTNIERKPVFERKENGAWVVVDDLESADRVTVYLHAHFGLLATPLGRFTRLANVRDPDSDTGWRVATPWRQSTTREMPTEDESERVECVIERTSMIPLDKFQLDRPARTIASAIAADSIGETVS